jgi:hypothetical protein
VCHVHSCSPLCDSCHRMRCLSLTGAPKEQQLSLSRRGNTSSRPDGQVPPCPQLPCLHRSPPSHPPATPPCLQCTTTTTTITTTCATAWRKRRAYRAGVDPEWQGMTAAKGAVHSPHRSCSSCLGTRGSPRLCAHQGVLSGMWMTRVMTWTAWRLQRARAMMGLAWHTVGRHRCSKLGNRSSRGSRGRGSNCHCNSSSNSRHSSRRRRSGRRT